MGGSIWKIPILMVWVMCWFSYSHAQENVLVSGSVIHESVEIKSEILGETVNYNIYLPRDYHTSTMKYPVLYLLHGYSDNETGWTQNGQVKRIADELIDQHKAAQMIIVMPDGGITWYVNCADGTRYEDFFVEELMPHIEDNYKARKGRQFTGIAGLSMGGYGSLMMGMRHPDRFAAVGALSGGFFTDDEIGEMGQDQWDRLLGQPFGEGISGEARLRGNYEEYSPEKMIAQYKEKKGNVRFYIDCGDDDFLILGNMNLHALMLKEKVDHEFRVRDGAHSWSYWRSGLRSILPFVSESFHR